MPTGTGLFPVGIFLPPEKLDMNKRRVAITGIGVVSPCGNDLTSFWDNMVNGRSGIGPIESFDCSNFHVKIAGEVRNLDAERHIKKKDQRRMDPFTIYGLYAAHEAIAHSGLNLSEENLDRIGVVTGSGTGGIHIVLQQTRQLDQKGPDRFSPFTVPQMIINILAGYISIDFGLCGPNFGLTSACSSATHCIGESMRMIQYGDADIMIAGGAEGSINELGIGGFSAIRALTTKYNDDPQRASRPFDADRSGFVSSEGAAIVVLEEWEHAVKRGAEIFCEVAGYGRTCDAYHITAPKSDGQGAARAMRLALEDAGVSPQELGYINAHGTSTELNDSTETTAIKIALGNDVAHRVPVSSIKSMTGHLLGAAGGVEAAAMAMCLRDGILPPTINYETPDPACDLDYVPNTAREVKIETALSNSLGFGGHNACLCFKKA
jgi:3-oxoacyl-[acyl-carrier-protein] synthase II